MTLSPVTRRGFVAFVAGSAAGARPQGKTHVPVGLQLVAVARNIQQDLPGTLRAVAKMGYEIVEFSANPYFNWTPPQAKEVRSLLDDVGLRCRSTHNEIVSFSGEGLSKAIELNQIIGSDTLVSVRGPAGTPGGGNRAAGAGGGAAGGGGRQPATPPGLDAWKRYNDQLSQAADRMRAAKMTLGFHNHEVEFQAVEGSRPIDLLAANRDITSFHLNLGLCLRGGGDPIAFVHQVPGRIQSVLCQDYQGQARWKETFAAAEAQGGLQFYLIQRTDGLSLVPREGSDLLDFAQKDLQYFRQLHG